MMPNPSSPLEDNMKKVFLASAITMGLMSGAVSAETIKGFSTDMSPDEFRSKIEDIGGYINRDHYSEMYGQLSIQAGTDYCDGCLTIGGAQIKSVSFLEDKSSHISLSFNVKDGDGQTLAESIVGKYGRYDSFDVSGSSVFYRWDLSRNLTMTVRKGGDFLSFKKDLKKDGDVSDF